MESWQWRNGIHRTQIPYVFHIEVVELTLYEKMANWVTFRSMNSKEIMTLYAKLTNWVTFRSMNSKEIMTLYAKLTNWVTFCSMICIDIMTLEVVN